MKSAKKSKLKRVILTAIVAVLVVLVAAQGITVYFYNVNFHQRFSSEGNTSVATFEEFDELERTQADFPSDKGQNLRGYYYSAKEKSSYKGLIVVNHGYGGGGHRYYLPQIDYLVQNNYLVFAFDKTGTDESGGENVKGLPQGIIDLQYTLKYLRADEKAKGLPLLLYGHSWGGYSVCSALETEQDVKAAVSLSGFNQSQDMLIDQGVSMYGGFVKWLTLFMKAYDYFLFGQTASMSSLKGLTATNAEVLLFHSEDDTMIVIENSFDLYQEKLSDRENLHFVRLEDKGHSVFVDGMDSNQDDYKLDTDIMAQVVAFYDGVLGKGEIEPE